jgi:hypothetical protein
VQLVDDLFGRRRGMLQVVSWASMGQCGTVAAATASLL